MQTAVVRALLSALVAGLIWGCAPYSEQELYAQADRLNLAKEQYVARKERCVQTGGSMVLRVPRLQEPRYQDYNMAKCVKR